MTVIHHPYLLASRGDCPGQAILHRLSNVRTVHILLLAVHGSDGIDSCAASIEADSVEPTASPEEVSALASHTLTSIGEGECVFVAAFVSLHVALLLQQVQALYRSPVGCKELR